MSLTGFLATADSYLGNIALGGGTGTDLSYEAIIVQSMSWLPPPAVKPLMPLPELQRDQTLDRDVWPGDPLPGQEPTWYSPLSLPVWGHAPLEPLPPLQSIDPTALTLPEGPALDKFYTPLSEPVRDPVLAERQTHRFPFFWLVLTQAETPETITLDDWFTRERLPVWSVKPLAPLPPMESIDPTALLQVEGTSPDKYWSPLSEPVRVGKPLVPLPELQRDQELEYSTFPPDPVSYETIVWFTPLSEPVWSVNPLAPLPPLESIDPTALLQVEGTSIDKYWSPLSVPVRDPSRRDTHRWPWFSLDLDTTQQPETIFEPALESMGLPTRPAPHFWPNGQGVLDLSPAQAAEVILVTDFDTPLSVPVLRNPPPVQPWTLADEEYDPAIFGYAFVIFHRPMLTGGLWTGGAWE